MQNLAFHRGETMVLACFSNGEPHFLTLSSPSGGQNSSESSVFVAAWSHSSPPHRLIFLRCAFRPAPAEQKIPPEICHADFHACVKSERFASTKRPLLRNWPFQPRSGTLFWTLSSPSGCQNSSESSVFVAAWSNFVVLGAWHVGFVLLALSRKWPRRLGETHFPVWQDAPWTRF